MSGRRAVILRILGVGSSLLLLLESCTHRHAAAAHPVTWDEISAAVAPPAGRRIAYGPAEQNFGELRLPAGPGPYPVAVILHGGCWRSQYGLSYMASFADALTRAGIATWSLEYRRVGDAGGGWPGTFEDVSRGADHVRTLARIEPLDLDRVVLVGHSAGGHLALWLAARRRLPPESPLLSPDPLRVRGVVALAGIPDLRSYSTGPIPCNAAVASLMGGPPDAVPARYGQASPIELLPLGVSSRLLRGSLDDVVPAAQAENFAAAARARGDDAEARTIDGAGHFDLVAPFSAAWPEVAREVSAMLATR